LAKEQNLEGWRKGLDWKKRIKIEFRKLQKTKKSGGKNKESRLKNSVKNYLDITKILQKKVADFQTIFTSNTIAENCTFIELE
jgi:hypothetical protein